MAFWEIVDKLRNGFEEIHLLTLSDLSHLDAELANEFLQVWKLLPYKIKDGLLTELLIMSDASIHFEFSSIYMIAIDDEDDNICCMAISGLWEYEHRDLIKILIEKLLYHQSHKVKSAAAFALGRFAVLAEERKLSNYDANSIKNSLLSVIKDDSISNDIKILAFEAVAVFSTSDIDDLISNMYYQKNVDFQKSAIYAMGRNGNLSWIPIILDELDNELHEIQCEAIRACEEIGEEKFVPSLIPLLASDELDVLLTVIKALGTIGGELSKNTLQNFTENYNSDLDVDNNLSEAISESLESIEIMQFTPKNNQL